MPAVTLPVPRSLFASQPSMHHLVPLTPAPPSSATRLHQIKRDAVNATAQRAHERPAERTSSNVHCSLARRGRSADDPMSRMSADDMVQSSMSTVDLDLASATIGIANNTDSRLIAFASTVVCKDKTDYLPVFNQAVTKRACSQH